MKVVYGASDEVVGAIAVPICNANLEGCFGPSFISVTADYFFFGVLCVQVWDYHASFRRDSTWIKSLVRLCFFLSVLTIIQSFFVMWSRNVIGFGIWTQGAAIPWSLWLAPVASAILSAAGQSFFIWRSFILTGRNWFLFGFLIAASLTIIVLCCLLSVLFAIDPFFFPPIQRLTITRLTLGVVIDASTTFAITYKLAKSMQPGYGTNANTFFKKWRAITFEAAIPPFLCQFVTLVVFLAKARSRDWDFTSAMLTPRLFVFSLMYTLNSRVESQQLSEGNSLGRSKATTHNATKTGASFPMGVLSTLNLNTRTTGTNSNIPTTSVAPTASYRVAQDVAAVHETSEVNLNRHTFTVGDGSDFTDDEVKFAMEEDPIEDSCTDSYRPKNLIERMIQRSAPT